VDLLIRGLLENWSAAEQLAQILKCSAKLSQGEERRT